MIDTFTFGNAITILLIVVSAIGGWFGVKFSVNRNTERIEELERQKTALWNWINEHEEDSGDFRTKFEVNQARLEGELKGLRESQSAQFNSIIERLSRLESKLDKLEERHERAS